MELVIAIAVGVTTLGMLYKLFFDTKEELFECIRFWFTPDVISLLRGEYIEDRWSQLKIFFWIAISSLMGYGTYATLS